REAYPFAWSPDGTRLLVRQTEAKANGLAWLRLSDGTIQALPRRHAYFDSASVSPDGKYIAVNAPPDDAGNEESNLYVMAADGSSEVRISPSPGYQEPI